MFNCRSYCLIYVVTFLCISLCIGSSHAKKCVETDKQALLNLKDGFISGRDILSSWNGENCCNWKGILCNNLTGHVTRLDLRFSNFTPVIGAEDLNNLPIWADLVMLNASAPLRGNNLTGFIPNNIGHMQMLESLDLSRNHLYGRMPASFSNLSFLSYMNLSFNNLSGEIPVSTQLQSFNASAYVGNIGLCGPPLTNQCQGDVVPPTGRVDKNGTNEDKDELINFGFYVSLGLGFCVGFWGVCGTLIIKSSWRHACFQFFNNINDWIYVTVVVFVATMKGRFQIQE